MNFLISFSFETYPVCFFPLKSEEKIYKFLKKITNVLFKLFLDF